MLPSLNENAQMISSYLAFLFRTITNTNQAFLLAPITTHVINLHGMLLPAMPANHAVRVPSKFYLRHSNL